MAISKNVTIVRINHADYQMTTEPAKPTDHCQLANCESKNGLQTMAITDEDEIHRSECCTCSQHKDLVTQHLVVVFSIFISTCDCCEH